MLEAQPVNVLLVLLGHKHVYAVIIFVINQVEKVYNLACRIYGC